MPATEMPFSAQEYAARLEKTRNAMEAKGIDVLFVEDPSNMAWLTGYDGWSFYVHQGVIVFKTAADEKVVAVEGISEVDEDDVLEDALEGEAEGSAEPGENEAGNDTAEGDETPPEA